MNTGRRLILLCLLGAALLPALTALATTRVVNSLNDSGAGTLRDTIAASAAGDTIVFTTNGTIALTSGELLIGRNLTITGPGATNLYIDGNGISIRVFEIANNATANISGLTISDGVALGANGTSQILSGGMGFGGGIYNEGTLALNNCILFNNLVVGGIGGSGPNGQGEGGPGSGGGIFNNGTMTLTGCTLYDNLAAGGSGGSEPVANPSASGDGGSGNGGGIANLGVLAMTNCTFFSNHAGGGNAGTGNLTGNGGSGTGGAIWSGGTSAAVVLVNCTISGNAALGGNAVVDNLTVNNGGDGFGGGLTFASGKMTLLNTVVAANTGTGGAGDPSGFISGPDLYYLGSPVTSLGHNLIGIADSRAWVADDLTGTGAAPLNPQLGPLQNNGGQTPTLALLANSPAIDAGDDTVLSAPYNVTTDQRGVHRPAGNHVDIGAYEFGGNTFLVTTPDDSGLGSLRSAIASATAGDRIVFSPLVTGTIGLTSGELLISQPLNIIGPGATSLTISGNQSNRVFHVSSSGALNLVGLTLANGSVTGAAGATDVAGGDGLGGGLLVEGSTSLADCVITNNIAIGGVGGYGGTGASAQPGATGGNGAGGGIYNSSLLSLLRCTLCGNSALGGQGGTGGRTSLETETGGTGGAASGAGLANTGIATLTNCTLSSNLAGAGQGGTGSSGAQKTDPSGKGGFGGSAHGAGLSPDSGSVTLTSCTISSNLSAAGNGGKSGSTIGGGTLGPGSANSGGLFSAGNVQLQNCLIAGNQAGTYPDVDGSVQSGGFNLIGIADGSGGWLVAEAGNLGNSSFPINPHLGPLQNNGGATPTMALLNGSPAIDQGNSFSLTTDQRGFVRPTDIGSIANAAGGDGSDIGAYEVAATMATSVLLSSAGYGNNHFQFLLTGQSGSNYVIQASTNLASANWTSIFTNASPFTFVDSNANSFPRRFYRGVSSP